MPAATLDYLFSYFVQQFQTAYQSSPCLRFLHDGLLTTSPTGTKWINEDSSSLKLSHLFSKVSTGAAATGHHMSL